MLTDEEKRELTRELNGPLKLIRIPLGKSHEATEFLKGLYRGGNGRFDPLVLINGNPVIEEGTKIGVFAEIYDKGGIVRIGANCDIASHASLNCADSHKKVLGLSSEIECKPITIGENVFIGQSAIILGGTNIGHHSVIGAGVLVPPGDYEPYTLFVGSPCHVKAGYYRRTVLEACQKD